MDSQSLGVIDTWTILKSTGAVRPISQNSRLEISNITTDVGEVILDYGRCEGGIPIFVVEDATSSGGQAEVPFRVVYSETREGIDHDTGSCIQPRLK